MAYETKQEDVVGEVSKARARGGVADARAETIRIASMLTIEAASAHSTIAGFFAAEFGTRGTMNKHGDTGND